MFSQHSNECTTPPQSVPKKLSDVSQIHITGIRVNSQHSKKAGQVHDVQTINIDIENSICQITHDVFLRANHILPKFGAAVKMTRLTCAGFWMHKITVVRFKLIFIIMRTYWFVKINEIITLKLIYKNKLEYHFLNVSLEIIRMQRIFKATNNERSST